MDIRLNYIRKLIDNVKVLLHICLCCDVLCRQGACNRLIPFQGVILKSLNGFMFSEVDSEPEEAEDVIGETNDVNYLPFNSNY
jgi:hypothetical protein